MALLVEDRLFPVEPHVRAIARELYATVEKAPIISPHGHTDPRWFAENEPFEDPAQLFVVPDHYVFRMLHSQGVALEDLGIAPLDGGAFERDPRRIWRVFAENYHFLRGTPSRLWLDYSFEKVFGIDVRLGPQTADHYYDHIADCLTRPQFRPRALFERFGIEAIATTEGPLDDLKWHEKIRASGWAGRVITTYRPDAVTDPDFEDFRQNVETFCALTNEDPAHFSGYLDAHRARRQFFREFGATATDHSHPNAATLNLNRADTEALYAKVITGKADAAEREAFRAQMLTEMAKLSLEDGLVMQIHSGSIRSHSAQIRGRFGRDKGYDIPAPVSFVRELQPLLEAVGEEPGMTLVIFTLDEATYTRELAPLAGVYPCLKLGPPWWFQDSYEGMMRFRQMTTETAGFYNTAGFNDDTRAFCSIPARHDVARRVDASYLATLVETGRLAEDEAFEVIQDLAHRLARQTYRL